MSLASRSAAGTVTVTIPPGTFFNVNVAEWFGSLTPTVGQKAMAASIPVVIALDQTSIPINDDGGSITVDGAVLVTGGPVSVDDGGGSLTVDTPQLPAALVGARLDTNVGAWLGSTAPTVGQKTMANSVPVVIASDQSTLSVVTPASIVASYAASTNGIVATATGANTVNSIAYLFHPNTNTKRIKILSISVSWTGNGGNNSLSARGNFITAENGAPGGTAQTINALDQADAASTLIFRTGATGAPTRTAGDLFSLAMTGGSAAQNSYEIFNATTFGKPIILEASVNRGFEIRTVIGGSNLASAVNLGVFYIWTEE